VVADERGVIARERRDLAAELRVGKERTQAGAVGAQRVGEDRRVEAVVLAASGLAAVSAALGLIGYTVYPASTSAATSRPRPVSIATRTLRGSPWCCSIARRSSAMPVGS
jgi:hypothetical protein